MHHRERKEEGGKRKKEKKNKREISKISCIDRNRIKIKTSCHFIHSMSPLQDTVIISNTKQKKKRKRKKIA